jgi:site-specific DNA-methyltransferase (adenine-specific)
MTLTLLNGDCLEIMKDLSGSSIDCFICDLPFGCLTGGAGKEKAKRKENGESVIAGCTWDIKIDLQKFWKEIRRLRKSDNTPCLMFCNTKFGIDLINSNPTEYRYDMVWNKSNAVGFLSANVKPMSSHEMIYVFSKKGAYYKRVNIKGDFPAGGGGTSTANFLPIAGMPNSGTTIEGERCPTSVITIANKKRKGGHPTEKPMELYKFLIERYCPENGVVLDPTAGSFNSCFSALEIKRNAIGIEKDKTFFDKGEQRKKNISNVIVE